MATIKKAQSGYKSRTVERNPEGTHKMITKSKTTARGESNSMKEKRTLKGVLKGAPRKSSPALNNPFDLEVEKAMSQERFKARGGKQMMKRADGSTSQRGLWDNIRAAAKRNKAAGKAGKKPTAAMLKQERKIKAKSKK
tara:strand:+ start:898 stop:1314 length:417 start_codon:yes stop_codon:yes gene_type:complete